jgi:hypothetical protein
LIGESILTNRAHSLPKTVERLTYNRDRLANTPLTDPAGFAGEHLEYEAQMFLAARDKLFQSAAPKLHPGNPAEAFNRNVLIESCVLHLRNLLDFFYPPSSSQSDDVSAADYIPGWNSGPLPRILEDAHKRANKELAHLTLKRKPGAPPDKAWDFAEIGNAMTPIIEEFFKRVDASKVPPRTKAVFDRIGAVVKVTLAEGPVFTTSRSEFGALGD